MKALTLFMLLMLAFPALAQTPQPAMRPPLFFSESWKPLSTPPDDHDAWPASQGGVANPNLELTLYGTYEQGNPVGGRRGEQRRADNLWTGTTTTPSAGSAARPHTTSWT